MRKTWSIPIALMAFTFATNASADATQSVDARPKNVGVIERIVAVVGHQAIFLTDLRARSKPFELVIDQSTAGDVAKRAAAISQMQKDLLDKMIDEAVEAREAADKRISVSADDINRALEMIATEQKLSAGDLLKRAHDQNMTTQEYRDELARQLLEGKLLQLRTYRIKGFSAMSTEDKNHALETDRLVFVQGLREKTFIEKRL